MAKVYRPVRALERGIDLLVALNRLGRAKPGVLAKETGLDRTTTYRLLETLEAKQLVVRREGDDSYILSSAVKRLSDSVSIGDSALSVVTRGLRELLNRVQWPSDYATFSGGSMVIEDTTHPFSAFSVHRAMIGRSRPVMQSALGRALIAGSTPSRRQTILQITARSQAMDASEAANEATVAHLLDDFERRGYAWSVGGTETHISAIALPVIARGDALGSVNILFFRSSMSIEECAARYLDDLRRSIAAMAQEIEADDLII